jgi:hypothetical protein
MVAGKKSIRAYPRNQRTNQFLRVLRPPVKSNSGLVAALPRQAIRENS